MRSKRSEQGGQAIVMVTLALFAMCGLIGLAVDLGWSYFVEKSAQSAADSASLAAVQAAFLVATDLTCAGGQVTCQASPTACPTPGGNLNIACTYAQQNGFANSNPRQNVLVQASDATTPPTVSGCNPLVQHPPTTGCVDTLYWVTVRVNQTIPQLFSAMLGNTEGLVSARATAAIVRSEAIGSLILLNRQNEIPWDDDDLGVNLYMGGSGTVRVPGGILLSSNTDRAGVISGSGDVISPFTYIRTPGDIDISGSGTWTAPPTNRPDGSPFYDPFRGKGQPPLTGLNMTAIPVPETNAGRAFLTETQCPGFVCPPGIYYAVNDAGAATGTQIEINNDPSPLSFGGSTFGSYVMFGGLNIGQRTVNFGPGRYVFAGTNGPTIPLFDNDNRARLLGGTGENSDAGRIFILTDSSYNGNSDLAQAVTTVADNTNGGWADAGATLGFSKSAIKAGQNQQSLVRLFGLNPDATEVQNAGLEDFAPVLLWQDQQNSRIEYTDQGQIDYSCPLASLDMPCPGSQTWPSDTPELQVWATPNTQYGGVIYQPRGAWTVFQASGTYAGALRIISGAMKIQGTPDLTLTSPSTPTTVLITALIE